MAYGQQTAPHPSVEDHPDTRTLIKHLLGGAYEITFASGVEAALGALAEASFDLLFVDINLGEEKSGVDLLRAVRERHSADTLPAIAVTAYAMPGDREDLLREGFDGYVSKPFTSDELLGAIEQASASGADAEEADVQAEDSLLVREEE